MVLLLALESVPVLLLGTEVSKLGWEFESET